MVNDFLSDISFDKQFQELYFEIIKEKLTVETKQKALGPKHYENLNSIEDSEAMITDYSGIFSEYLYSTYKTHFFTSCEQ
jgi:hypothetical protein